MQSRNLFLFVCVSNHNSGIPRPKLLNKELGRTTEMF